MYPAYRILSFDGGGVRGVIAARLLHRLAQYDPNLLNSIDLLSGTSTGAIMAMSIAHGLSTQAIFDLYYKRSKEIFSNSLFRKIDFQVFFAKYNNTGMKKVLNETFGENTTLGDLKKKVLVCALDLDSYDCNGIRSYKPKFFHNLIGQQPEELLIKVVDVLMYSTAAPTYFPAYKGFADGGLVANNPSVCALAQALDPKTMPQPSPSDIYLMSIGTGKINSYVAGTDMDWGFVQWATSIIELMMNGSIDVADYQCRQLLKGNYCRVNPYLDTTFELDSINEIDRMVEAADSFDLTLHAQWLKVNFGCDTSANG
jgi:patatin-like phospholipase/acyl hydrolase